MQAVAHAEGVHGACFHPLAKGHSHQGQSLVSGFRKKGENKLNLLKGCGSLPLWGDWLDQSWMDNQQGKKKKNNLLG